MRPQSSTSEKPNYLRAEWTFVAGFALLQSGTLSHFVNDAWAKALPDQSTRHASSAAVMYAPDAYRVAMPAILRVLINPPISIHLHYAFAGLDFIFSAAALILFARFAVRDIPLTKENRAQRAIVTALFFAFAQFPLAWVIPWQRPETMASAFFLAAALWCIAKANGRNIWTGLLLILTLLQSLARTDVPFAFGCGVILAGLTGFPADNRQKRILLSAGCYVAAVAAATQLYLQFIQFPGLHYPPGVPLFTYRFNLMPHNFANGILGVLPLLFGLAPAIFAWREAPILHRAILCGSAIYLALWATVAILDEVRVYVPFLLMLCILAASAWGGTYGNLSSSRKERQAEIPTGD